MTFVQTVFTVRQLAERWNVSIRSIYDLCARGELDTFGSVTASEFARSTSINNTRPSMPRSDADDSPRYKLYQRGHRFYARRRTNGAWHRISTGGIQAGARQKSGQPIYGAGAGRARTAVTTDHRRHSPRLSCTWSRSREAYATLDAAARALRRHIGDLQPDHLTKERVRFDGCQRRAEGHLVGSPAARRKKPIADGTIIRAWVTLRAALKWAREEKWIVDVPAIPTLLNPWAGTAGSHERMPIGCSPRRQRCIFQRPPLALHTAARTGAPLELQWGRLVVFHATGVVELLGAGTATRSGADRCRMTKRVA